jgi:hypothetical protein
MPSKPTVQNPSPTPNQRVAHFGEKGIRLFVRQFTPPHTRLQRVFDAAFGLLLPIAVLLMDPAVFKSGIPFFPELYNFGPSLLGEVRVFAYVLIGLGLLAMAWFLFIGEFPPAINSFFMGIFLIGAGVAFFLGFFLLITTTPAILAVLLDMAHFDPSSLDPDDLALVYLLGAAFLTGAAMIPICFVFFRNCLKALIGIIGRLKWYQALIAILLAGFVLFSLPIAAQVMADVFVDQMISRLIENKESIDRFAVQGLQMAFWCDRSCYGRLATAYRNAEDVTEKERLGKIYFLIRGHDIHDDLWKILD